MNESQESFPEKDPSVGSNTSVKEILQLGVKSETSQDGGAILLESEASKTSVEPCALYPKYKEECPSTCGMLTETDVFVNEITETIYKPLKKPLKKCGTQKRKPIMKSGWMELNTLIPGFEIDDEIFTSITFNENLLICIFRNDELYPTPVGALSLDIQSARGAPIHHQHNINIWPKFLVHLSSQLDFVGHNGGSRITAWVDRDLQTLEERRTEFLKMDDGLDRQTLYINSQPEFYYLRHNKKEDIFYSPQKAKNLICEGSNFILMRYLAISRFIGTIEVSTLYIDGSICRNIYTCKGPSSGLINNQKLDVCKIYRRIIEKCGIEHKCITLMTLNGQIIKQEWSNCDYILQLNPLIKINDGKPTEQRIPLENKSFTEDLQMLSLYLDSKIAASKHIENYMEDHPEIKDILSDYIHTIIQLKPEDIYTFTAKYFLAFTPELLPLSEYFEKSTESDSESDSNDSKIWKYI